MRSYEVASGKIRMTHKFATEQEALEWAEHNSKGRGQFVVIPTGAPLPQPFEGHSALLPHDVEVMMADAILDGRCDQQFVLDLRRMLLPRYAVGRKRKCGACKGSGLKTVRSGKTTEQTACPACNGSGH